MNHITEQLYTLGRSVHLTDKEKSAMRHFLQAVMAHHPVVHTILRYYRWVPRVFVMALSVVLVVGTISYIAEQSGPGQFLYAIKTSTNEKVRDYLPVSPETEMTWEVTKQERRLAELEVLAAEYGI